MKENFSEETYNTIKNAGLLSKNAGSKEVSSAYLLLALMKNDNMRSLVNNLAFEDVSVAVDKVKVSPEEGVNPGGLLSLEAKHIINLAITLSAGDGLQVAHNVHLLYAIFVTRTPESGAGDVLRGLIPEEKHSEIQATLTAARHRAADNRFAENPETNAQNMSKPATPHLNKFSTDLTGKAMNGELDPVIGRDEEVDRLIQILSRRTKNNPVLLGEPGVGKTAIVEGLAQALVTADDLPDNMRNKRLFNLDMTAVVAGAKYRGDFEERLKGIVKEVQSDKDIILFIDEIHAMMSAGSSDGGMTAGNILKPLLARGELQTVGATTYEEYRKYFEKDAALARRFQPVPVEEPTVDEAVLILTGLKSYYEEHHGVKITDEAIVSAVNLSHRYITDRFLPDKAIDLVDEAASRVRMTAFKTPVELVAINSEILRLIEQKDEAVQTEDFDLASKIKLEERSLRRQREDIERVWLEKKGTFGVQVTPVEIAEVLTRATGIPVVQFTGDERAKLMSMESTLGDTVIGQKEAIKTLAKSIRRQRAGLSNPNRPNGSFIFAGPTGVGKTELSKALAKFMFGSSDALIALDMSEYSEKHTVSRLFGAPPGYVGYEEGGQLTEAVKKKPYSVILLDEIEKAHPSLFNPLLQMLEEGRLTDGQGRVVDFKNTIIIMTTNLGAREMTANPLGFQNFTSQEDVYDVMKSKVMEELKQNFRPEFLNRLDNILVFPQLSKDEITQIVDLFIKDVNSRLMTQGIVLNLTQDAKDFLATEGYDKNFGARPLRRAIQQYVEDELSEEILFGKIEANSSVLVDLAKDRKSLVFITAELNIDGQMTQEPVTSVV